MSDNIIGNILRQESKGQNSDKLFEVAWAETDQYFVLVWAKDKEQARRMWLERYKEHWCAELFRRDLCGGPRIEEVVTDVRA